MSENKTNIPYYLNSSTNKTHILDYFNSCDNKEPDKEWLRQAQIEYTMNLMTLFSSIQCIEGTFSLQVKEGSNSYQEPPRRLAYALQKQLNEELEELQKQQTVIPLGIDKMSECCNRFVWVSKWYMYKFISTCYLIYLLSMWVLWVDEYLSWVL